MPQGVLDSSVYPAACKCCCVFPKGKRALAFGNFQEMAPLTASVDEAYEWNFVICSLCGASKVMKSIKLDQI